MSGSDKHNVLITDVTSGVGRHLARFLHRDPKIGNIIGLGLEREPQGLLGFDPARFAYVPTNILDRYEVTKLLGSSTFKEAHIDSVVHLAFHSSPGDMRAFQLNVDGTRQLLEQCSHMDGIDKFILKSSCVVYRVDHATPVQLDEEAELNFEPDADPWIRGKVGAEMICRSYMDHDEVKMVILRFASIVGSDVRGQLNAYFRSRWILKVAGFNPLINLIHIDDMCRAFGTAIHKDVSGIFNVSGKDTAPITTFAELMDLKTVALPEPLMAPINWVMRNLGLTRYYYSVDAMRLKYPCLLDTTRAGEVLGFEPRHAIDL